MEESEIIENGLYRLTPNKGDSNWCKHNLLVASKKTGKWIFTDTYWGSYQDQTRYGFEEIRDRITFEFDLNYSKEVSEKEYKQYDDKNTAWIPMGSSSERFLIDIRYPKSKSKIIELLEQRIEECESKIKSLQFNIKHNKDELDKIKNNGNFREVNIW